MLPIKSIFFFLSVISVNASLECLGWGLINPFVGLFCHFKPDTFHAAENATVSAVEHAVDSVKDLVKFDITHNPVEITYDFVNTSLREGSGTGVRQLEDNIEDYKDVTIGFGKESANQVVQIVDLLSWNDLSFCLITGAGRLALDVKRKSRRRATAPSVGEAVRMANGCVSDKFKKLANPAVFNITGRMIWSISSRVLQILTRPRSESTHRCNDLRHRNSIRPHRTRSEGWCHGCRRCRRPRHPGKRGDNTHLQESCQGRYCGTFCQ